MDKKIKFSDRPTKEKIIYAVVVGILCVSAIIVGIVSVANREEPLPEDNPPADGDVGDSGENQDGADKDEGKEENKGPARVTYTAPVVGEVMKGHSTEVPVFSDTLGEWRIHTGIDVSAEEGAEVYAAADGTVSRVYRDHLLGNTVEITHADGAVSCYSNLANGVSVSEGDAVNAGALIGTVGDTSLTELADEPHLHFEIKVNGVSVNPLDYISEESKSASLGITDL